MGHFLVILGLEEFLFTTMGLHLIMHQEGLEVNYWFN